MMSKISEAGLLHWMYDKLESRTLLTTSFWFFSRCASLQPTRPLRAAGFQALAPYLSEATSSSV